MSRAPLPLMGMTSPLRGLVDAGQGLALVVDDLDGLAQLLCGDGVAGGLLDDLLEVGDLIGPLGDVLLALHLGHVHDVDRGLLGHDLVGLLLAVAGGLAHEEVGDAEEGAGLADERAHGGLDQRAGGLGEDLLAVGDPELRAAAQAGHDAVGCDDDLVGDIDAEGAEDLLALLLGLDELGGTDAVDVCHDHVPEGHALGAVLLAEVGVAEGGGKDGAELVVGIEVHAELFPHGMAVNCHGACLSLLAAGRAPGVRAGRRSVCGTDPAAECLGWAASAKPGVPGRRRPVHGWRAGAPVAEGGACPDDASIAGCGGGLERGDEAQQPSGEGIPREVRAVDGLGRGEHGFPDGVCQALLEGGQVALEGFVDVCHAR